uniref:Putative rop guanine nucleotide exchange factor 14 n=1 Tax=Davidia involucrata TaxID=16924 RepID=A0A5B7AWU5_DAVIN
MMMMRKRLACCTRDREISIDFDEQERIMTYNGLESCILNIESYGNESGTSRGDGCVTDSFDEDDSSCSSSNNAFGSFSSHWMMMKKDEEGMDEWEVSKSPQHFYVKEKPTYTIQLSDVETMKERFAKLLLGEDVTGGHKGISTALALSNAITNLAASVFGELWKLEPLPEERKSKWRREMDWLLSPTNHMVELVPAKQNGANGRSLEIMTPKARADIHMNLPALQKLDSMLIETLDSMVNTEFWYAEGGSRAEGRSRSARQSKRWWLPSPQVPNSGLSDTERKKLLYQGKMVRQVLKAAKSINENVLLEMPVPTIIKDALPKSGRASLGEEVYRILTAESNSIEEMLNSLNLKSEHSVLEAINRLEAAVFAWKEKITEQASGKSPVRTSWTFIKDPISELYKTQFLLERAEALLQQLKTRYPNLPQTFLDVTKIQYGKDVGRSILEAYSRVLGNLAFSILSRIGDILQEEVLSNPNSPVPTCSFPGINLTRVSDSPVLGQRIRHSLIDHMNKVNGQFCDSNAGNASDLELSCGEAKTSWLTPTPSRSRVWCIGREACSSLSPRNSP